MPKEVSTRTSSEGGLGELKKGDEKEKKATTLGFSGCVLCRVRKKKCDEKKPGCDACERLSIECMGYTVKRPLFLQNKDNLASVRAQITTFLLHSGKIARRKDAGGDDQPCDTTGEEPPEVLRFSFSLETKQDRAGSRAPARTKTKKAASKVSRSPSASPSRETSPVEVNVDGEYHLNAGIQLYSLSSPLLLPTSETTHSSSFRHLPIPLPYSSPPPASITLHDSPSMFASTSTSHHVSDPYYPPPASFSNLNSVVANQSLHPPFQHFLFHSSSNSTDLAPFPSLNEAYFPPPEPQPSPAFAEQPWSNGWLPLEPPDLSASRITSFDEDLLSEFATETESEGIDSRRTGLEVVSRGVWDSPLERLGLPRREFDYIKFCVGLMESPKPVPGSAEWRSLPEYMRRPGGLQLFTEGQESTARALLYTAVRIPAARDVLCCFAARFQAIRGALDDGKPRPKVWAPPSADIDPYSQVYRDRAYQSLMESLANHSIDVVSALYTAQRMIASELIRGGNQGWVQPLLIARRCLERLMGERAMRGELEPGPLPFLVVYMLKYTLWFDILGTIALAQETELYTLYEAVLLKADSGLNMNAAMGFSNGGLHVVLQTSALAAWKRSSLVDGTFSPGLLVARGLEIQQNINTQWLPFNQPSNPLLPYKLALFQIHLHGAQLYLTSTLSPPDPHDPIIQRSVELLIQATHLLSPDPSTRRSATFPLTVAGCLCTVEQRDVFRGWLEGRLVGPSLWLMENVWEQRDLAEAQEEGSGKYIDWWVVMKELGLEMMMS